MFLSSELSCSLLTAGTAGAANSLTFVPLQTGEGDWTADLSRTGRTPPVV